MVLSTNALEGVTTTIFSTNNNQQVITNSFPDGGTSVQVFYRDGKSFNRRPGNRRANRCITPIMSQTTAATIGRSSAGDQLDASGNDTSEWTESILDGASRAYKSVYASPGTNHPFSISYYNTDTNDSTRAGLLTNSVDPDGVSTLYLFDDEARPWADTRAGYKLKTGTLTGVAPIASP